MKKDMMKIERNNNYNGETEFEGEYLNDKGNWKGKEYDRRWYIKIWSWIFKW